MREPVPEQVQPVSVLELVLASGLALAQVRWLQPASALGPALPGLQQFPLLVVQRASARVRLPLVSAAAA